MILDCKIRQLSFIQNKDNDLGVAYDDIDVGQGIDYKMAVIMSVDDEIELLGIKCIRKRDNDDPDLLRGELNEMAQENKLLRNEIVKLKQQLRENQQVLQETMSNQLVKLLLCNHLSTKCFG